MYRKLIRLAALVLAFLLAFTACQQPGNDTEAPTEGTTEAPTESSEQKTEATEPSETEPAEPESSETEPAAPASEEKTVTDMIGREVTVKPGSYSKVVCIGAGALRMYTYVADVGLLAGVEDIDNESLENRPKMFDKVARPYVLAYGDVFQTLPSAGVGGPNAQAAEAEKLLALEPDIVISEYEDVEKEDSLEEALGVPVITLRSGPNGVFDEAFKGSMRLLGEIFGTGERAEELIAYIESEEAEISRRTAGIADSEMPLVYICGLGNWGTTNHLMTASSYYPFMVAHIKNALSDETKGIHPIEEETFLALGETADILILDAAAVKNIKPLYAEDPTMFDTFKAWQEGEVYLEMAYNAYYTNYEIALINTWFLAKSVYPDYFTDVEMDAKTDEVTEMFLGKKLAEEIYALPQSFGGYQKIGTETFFD